MTDRDPFEADIPPTYCPTCHEKLLKEQDLPAHMERHTPVNGPVKEGGKILSAECPKRCGRWFETSKGSERLRLKEHRKLCDGLPPLPIDMEKARGRKWFCSEHRYGTDGPRAWGLHKKEHHGNKEPGHEKRLALAVLREQRARLVEGLRELDEAIKDLDGTGEKP